MAADVEEDTGAEQAIADQFRQRMAGLRRLPRHERVHAARAAKLWRAQALNAVKEKRAASRQHRRLLRRHRMPTPGQ